MESLKILGFKCNMKAGRCVKYQVWIRLICTSLHFSGLLVGQDLDSSELSEVC